MANATIFVGVISLVAALILTPVIRAISTRIGFVDNPGERKIHTRAMPYGGGLALAISMALALAIAVLMKFQISRSSDDPGSRTLWVIVAGALAAMTLGIVDDKLKLTAKTKLLFQLLIALGTVAGGVRITALVGDTLLMQAITVVWITLITNSFNLLDNMDGLCCGTAAISSATLACVAFPGGQTEMTFGLVALSGACAGFYCYNRFPATIFLGDGGSLLCGYLMAVFTVLVTYYRYQEPSHLAVGIPVLVLAIPLYDTASVIFIRLREGRPIMRGDTSHFSHRLVDLGMSRRAAVTTIHLACLAIGLPATVLGQLSPGRGMLIVAQAAMVLAVIAMLEHAGRQKGK